MNRLPTLIVALIAIMTQVPNAEAHDLTGKYTVGTTPLLSFVCSPCIVAGSGIHFGGYEFPAINEVGVKVTIVDDSGGPVNFVVCQDFNGSNCGQPGLEPVVRGCGNVGDLTTSEIPFVKNVPIIVFVRVTSQDCVGSTAIGGTITLTYSP